ncbi:NAD(P)/FAD-dependent oxidoreductase [Alteraurantiacibacter palmitatis]|uniref:NAD(P)/FAD-dependent oxidoreductase n=1 Tax=Alteraurantiacibacter palmitatis TaxID=2054628 RepID=A0ABV7E6L3_9SPHN
MRIEDPLILGAGPAGCAAAIVLAQGGAQPVLLDRQAEVSDTICGGFLSWRTAAQLLALGIDLPALDAHPVTRLRLIAGSRIAEVNLPGTAWGLSRRTLDTAMRKRAVEAGAVLEIDTIRNLAGTLAVGQRQEWHGSALFLASGKHDVRRAPRPRSAADPAMGLRLRTRPSPALAQELAATIELHLFAGGYAGIVMQEDGTANICLALRKSLLTGAGGDPRQLLEQLSTANPALARRLEPGWHAARIDCIAAVPYGWIARETQHGLFRLGDQAAVIPSLAGEGMGIAIASGTAAAARFLASGPAAAPAFQQAFASAAVRPVQMARLARRLAESPLGQRAGLALAAALPAFAGLLMDSTRIALPETKPPLSCT